MYCLETAWPWRRCLSRSKTSQRATARRCSTRRLHQASWRAAATGRGSTKMMILGRTRRTAPRTTTRRPYKPSRRLAPARGVALGEVLSIGTGPRRTAVFGDARRRRGADGLSLLPQWGRERERRPALCDVRDVLLRGRPPLVFAGGIKSRRGGWAVPSRSAARRRPSSAGEEAAGHSNCIFES